MQTATQRITQDYIEPGLKIAQIVIAVLGMSLIPWVMYVSKSIHHGQIEMAELRVEVINLKDEVKGLREEIRILRDK